MTVYARKPVTRISKLGLPSTAYGRSSALLGTRWTTKWQSPESVYRRRKCATTDLAYVLGTIMNSGALQKLSTYILR